MCTISPSIFRELNDEILSLNNDSKAWTQLEKFKGINSADMGSVNPLKFEIISARTVEEEGKKKYVAYMVVVKIKGEVEDCQPSVLERRYTDFLLLYNSLKRDYPFHLETVRFPKKAIFGNFTQEVIFDRRMGFEAFLDIIATSTQLRASQTVATFLQKRELTKALQLIEEKKFEQATLLIENCFWLMNKMQTDRAPLVLQNLCLLVSLAAINHDSRALGFAGLAVRRYQSVSDVDLLRYYIPLLNVTLELCNKSGKDGSSISEYLDNLKRRGIGHNSSLSLMQIVMKDLLEDKNFK